MKKILLLLLFLIPVVYADTIGDFTKGTNVEIYQTCDTCNYCNFTSIKYPNSTELLTNIEAVQDNTYFYYVINSENFTELGTYRYCYDCGDDQSNDVGCVDFDIVTIYKDDIINNLWFDSTALNPTTTSGVLMFIFTFLIIVALVVLSETLKVPAIALLVGILSFFYGMMLYTKISSIIGIMFITISVSYMIRSIAMAR